MHTCANNNGRMKLLHLHFDVVTLTLNVTLYSVPGGMHGASWQQVP